MDDNFNNTVHLQIHDFLPKYPGIDESKYNSLNTYPNTSFNQAIYMKKEFYENRPTKAIVFPKERGTLTNYQTTIARYMSSHTPYNRLLLVHAMGSGKTCSAIGAIEQIRRETPFYTKAVILASSENLLRNFRNELVFKCTSGEYIPENFHKLSDKKKTYRLNATTKFYEMNTFVKFAKYIKQLNPELIAKMYSNTIIVVDEVHNLRIQKKNYKETLQTYQQFLRFFEVVPNCKALFLSGTPMKDSPFEIAAVSNLLLRPEKRFPTGDDFMREYMDKKGEGLFLMKPSKTQEFKDRLRGKISFLREAVTSIKKLYIGEKNYQGLTHFIVNPLVMSEFQTKYYLKAYKKDSRKKDVTDDDEKNKKGFFNNVREASLFIYPDGSYGSKGFKKYIMESKKAATIVKKSHIKYKFNPKENIQEKLDGKTDEERLTKLGKYSILYAKVIDKILNTPGNCFVYSSIINGSGIILMSLILELYGYSRATGYEKTKGKRYALFTGDTRNTGKIVDRFNKSDNKYGEYIQVILGSKAISEGYSFKNILFECINTPHWNYSETAQALARGIRLGSHKDLPDSQVEIMQPITIPNRKSVRKYIPEQNVNDLSIDLRMYKISQDKDISIQSIIRLLMETSFDCMLNYMRNHVDNGVDGSRECEYMSCNYKCDGIDEKIIQRGINESDIDYSTYNLYYLSSYISPIRKSIEKLLRKNIHMSLENILDNLKEQFGEEDIMNAIYTLNEKSSNREYDYMTFFETYKKSELDNIIHDIEKLFRKSTHYSLSSLFENLDHCTKYSVLTALRYIINNNVIIFDRYNLPTYMKESNNLYFLVNTLNVNGSGYLSYYTENPCVNIEVDYEDILSQLKKDLLPNMVVDILKENDQKDFFQRISTLPKNIQVFIVEAALLAKKKESEVNIAKNILKVYKPYISKLEDTLYVTLLQDDGIYRCATNLEKMDDWKECDTKMVEKLFKYQENLLQERKKNPYKLIGYTNGDNFCLLDTKNDDNRNDKKQKETKHKDDKRKEDKRTVRTGRMCSTLKYADLVTLIIDRFENKIPIADYEPLSREDLMKHLSGEKIYKSFKKNIGDRSDDFLRYLLGIHKKLQLTTVRKICDFIRESLGEFVYPNETCGAQGKKKIKTVKTTVLKTSLRVFDEKSWEKKIAINTIKKELDNAVKNSYQNMQLIIKGNTKVVAIFDLVDGVVSNMYIKKSYYKNEGDNILNFIVDYINSKGYTGPTVKKIQGIRKFFESSYAMYKLKVVGADNNYIYYN